MTTITLSAHPDGDPAPYVDVLAEGFPGGTSTVTVWRTAGGRAEKVRGLVRVSAGGIVTARDFAAGRGVESAYRVQMFDGAGEFTAWSDYESVTLDSDGRTWIHNPFDPSTSIVVDMLNNAAASRRRPLDAEVLRVQGRSAGIAMFGTRQGLSRIVLDCVTRSAEDAVRFDALFGEYDDSTTVPILCIRTPPEMRLPPTLYALVADPEQIPVNILARGEDVRWAMTGDEVSAPAEAIIVSLLGYDDFTAFYASYNAFTAAYVDYKAAQRDYSIAGTV